MEIREQLLKKIDVEIAQLERERAVELPRQLAEAAAHGDLSENAEYEAAKHRRDIVELLLGRLYRKKTAVNNINTRMIPRDAIGFWSEVELVDLDTGDEITYKLVTSDESEPKQGRVSITSPIGRALAGHTVGDQVEVSTPRGTRSYEVAAFTTIHDSSGDG